MTVEFNISQTGLTTIRAYNPTREQFVLYAKEAFSNPSAERLTDVTRVRDNAGTTISISGKNHKPTRYKVIKNIMTTNLKKVLNTFKRIFK